MTIESWKAEFYPTPADKVAKADAAAHAYQKWCGFTAYAIYLHDVSYDTLLEKFAGRTSCALCTHYIEFECPMCPLREQGDYCLRNNSPYKQAQAGNPLPLLDALHQLGTTKSQYHESEAEARRSH